MAEQNYLTFGGIGSDPTGAYTPYDSGWAVVYTDGVATWRPNATGIITNPGATATDATDVYYTNEFTVIGKDLAGAEVYYPASGNAQITMQWEWFDSKGTTWPVVPGTAASQTGGTWTGVGTDGVGADSEQILPPTGVEWDIMLRGSKIRLRVDVVDAGSDGVSAGIVTTAIDAINHISTGVKIVLFMDKTAENNDTINNPITFGGIGQDPS